MVGAIDADVQAIPQLIKTEIRLEESRLSRAMHEVRASVDQRLDDFLIHVDHIIGSIR